jgi:ABC-type bacteriocin/lantibiotic exporter with double-glycine peptidase domain
MKEFFAAIWRGTGRRQMVLIGLSLAIASLAAFPIEFQKRIINAISDKSSFNVISEFGIQMMVFIFLSQTLKFIFRYRADMLGEWATKYLRNRKLQRQVEESKPGQKHAEKGTFANIVSAESEAIGHFVGRAFADPVLQIGTLISVLSYIAATQPRLGIIIVCTSIPQALLVFFLQPRINALVREHIEKLRNSINSITSSELSSIKQALVQNFDRIYQMRRNVIILKCFNKYFTGLTNGAGLIAVLVYGGWLVTEGRSDVGSIVAAAIALGRVQQPWRELIAYFRIINVMNVRYELLRESFFDMPKRQGGSGI